MIIDYTDVNNVFKLDDIVYAFAYKPTSDKEGKSKYSKPVRGRLVAGGTALKDAEARKRLNPFIRYFVPFKKNGIDLAWSKAVTIYARQFSLDEDECKKCYNELIQKQIFWHEQEIKKLEKDLL